MMPETKDYFALFGLEQSIEVELSVLDAAYEKLTLETHPDFFATAPAAEKEAAERLSARINEGYRVLSREGLRAAYLLGLLSRERKLDAQRLPDGFLQEMFMVSEEVDDLDGSADPQQAAELTRVLQGRMDETRQARNRLFAQAVGGGEEGSTENIPEPLLQTIQEHLNCERYFQRLLDTLGEKTE